MSWSHDQACQSNREHIARPLFYLSMEELSDKFYYVYSSSLSNKIQIKIGTLEGKKKHIEYEKLLEDPILKYAGMNQENGCADLMVECQVFDRSHPLALPVCTSYKAFTSRWNWNEWITLPVQFCDLPRTALLVLTIYDCIGPHKLGPVGGTTISLFSKHGVFRQGMLDLRVWPNRAADGNFPSTSPGKPKGNGKEEMPRLAKLAKKHRNGHLTKVDWLDRLTFREIELINEREKRESDYLYLMIEFPTMYVDGLLHSIVYFEQNGEDVIQYRQNDIVSVPDHEILKENLVESKHHRLARALRNGYSDKDAKPNAAMRDILNKIIFYPPTKILSNEEQDHVWKYRFYLSTQKKALAKFLKCVNWHQPSEADQARAMMEIWSPMDVEDALELLSSNFTEPTVRRYAVSRLKQTSDEEILLYLLQLVQALKYENFQTIDEAYARVKTGRDVVLPEDRDPHLEKKESKESGSTITNEPLGRSSSYNQADQLASSATNSVIEVDPVESSPAVADEGEPHSCNIYTDSGNTETLQSYMDEESVSDLASFLIHRAKNNALLANYLYWHLLVECEDQEPTIKQDIMVRKMYLTVMKTFSQVLAHGTPEMQMKRCVLSKQQKFLDKLVKLAKVVASESGGRRKKVEKLQELLADSEKFKFNFASFDPVPLPLDPSVVVKGIIPEKANLFKSAQVPAKLHFVTSDDKEYIAIFKNGDDLRQDQLILQMIKLMDKLLRKENLDLRLTPYKVLATSTRHGFVQYIDSVTVAEVLATEGTIQNYFKKLNPQENAPYGIAPNVMENYVRSCAGYCVITYILGVGDRHFDNLLLTPDGKLFHIDFSYILGRDPKPMPPPMKMSKEMVEGMGGMNSEHYQEFKKQTYTAFLHLRRHANLMLNLFTLMVDTSIPDIAIEPDKTVKKIQDRLQLNTGDEETVQNIQFLIDSSVSAVMATIMENFHKYAQYFRR